MLIQRDMDIPGGATRPNRCGKTSSRASRAFMGTGVGLGTRLLEWKLTRIVKGIWWRLQILAVTHTYRLRSSRGPPAEWWPLSWPDPARPRRVRCPRNSNLAAKSAKCPFLPPRKFNFRSFCTRGFRCQPKSEDINRFLKQFWSIFIVKAYFMLQVLDPKRLRKALWWIRSNSARPETHFAPFSKFDFRGGQSVRGRTESRENGHQAVGQPQQLLQPCVFQLQQKILYERIPQPILAISR